MTLIDRLRVERFEELGKDDYQRLLAKVKTNFLATCEGNINIPSHTHHN